MSDIDDMIAAAKTEVAQRADKIRSARRCPSCGVYTGQHHLPDCPDYVPVEDRVGNDRYLFGDDDGS